MSTKKSIALGDHGTSVNGGDKGGVCAIMSQSYCGLYS